jgi:catechol 2,3-dioxygenase-like lactoylglutathione lyase family enzyme
MSTEIQAVHHVGLVVKDLDRSVHFYHDLLGLPLVNGPTPWFEGKELAKGVGVPDAKLRLVALRAGETVLELIEYSENPPGSTQPPPNNSLGAAHVCLKVVDLHTTKRELEGQGVQFYSDVTVVDDGPLAGWRWVYFSDPDGLTLELVEIAYDDHETRERAVAEYLRSRPSLADTEAPARR